MTAELPGARQATVERRAAERVLEIGTLGGYGAIWLARALPEGGRLVTLEADARHAEVARANFAARWDGMALILVRA